MKIINTFVLVQILLVLALAYDCELDSIYA